MPQFLVILTMALSATTASSSSQRQTDGQTFYQLFMDGRDAGSLHYWFDGRGPGSEYYWYQSRDEHTEFYWFNGRGPGSEYYWLDSREIGSQFYWYDGRGAWSQYGWFAGNSCMSEYEWYHERGCNFSEGFRTHIVATCLGVRLDIEPCRLIWQWADSHTDWGWAFRRSMEQNGLRSRRFENSRLYRNTPG